MLTIYLYTKYNLSFMLGFYCPGMNLSFITFDVKNLIYHHYK